MSHQPVIPWEEGKDGGASLTRNEREGKGEREPSFDRSEKDPAFLHQRGKRRIELYGKRESSQKGRKDFR